MTTEIELRETIAEAVLGHTTFVGVMASPTHWAYGKGWFAHCGTSYEDEKGCGWTSEPDTYPNKTEAQRAAALHLAEQIDKAVFQ